MNQECKIDLTVSPDYWDAATQLEQLLPPQIDIRQLSGGVSLAEALAEQHHRGCPQAFDALTCLCDIANRFGANRTVEFLQQRKHAEQSASSQNNGSVALFASLVSDAF